MKKTLTLLSLMAFLATGALVQAQTRQISPTLRPQEAKTRPHGKPHKSAVHKKKNKGEKDHPLPKSQKK